ncbi:MAG: response regulator [Bacteriovoracaceae bacterium]|nr:response regulator [Bacteriovoracaceae bacterium]
MSFDILLVDDSFTARAIMIKTLSMTGVPIATIHQASNGKEGLSVIEKNRINLIFLDMNMPIMGGEEMIHNMEKLNVLRDIRIIITSSEGQTPRIKQLQKMGVCIYLQKPFTPEKIKEITDSLMGGKNG